MSGAITAAVVVGGASIYGANKAAEAGEGAADTMAQAEQNKLNYLQETNEGAQFYKEKALDTLGGWYGLAPRGSAQADATQYDEYGTQISDLESQIAQGRARDYNDDRGYYTERNNEIQDLQRQQGLLDYDPNAPQQQQQQGYSGQQALINDVQSSPFYGSMISQGEDAASRLAAQQGLRRSGNLEERYVQNSQNVLQGLVGQRLQGLSGMANLGTNENNIGNSMANVGSIQGQGQVASAQSQQQGYQNALTGIGTAAGQYFGNQPPQQQQQLIGGNDPYGYGTNKYKNQYGSGGNYYYDSQPNTFKDLV